MGNMSRYRNGTAEVSVEVPKEVAKKYAKVFTDYGLIERADDITSAIDRYGASDVSVKLTALPVGVLESMIPATGERKSTVTLLKGFIRVLGDSRAKVGNLRLLPEALAKYLVMDAIDGWIYLNKDNEERLAYLVDDIQYHESSGDNSARVTVHLKANRATIKENRGSGSEIHTKTIRFGADDIVGKCAADVLLESGWLKETKELKIEYLEYFNSFRNYVSRSFAQFTAHGEAMEIGSYSWSNGSRYTVAAGTKIVNDEDLAIRSITTRSDNSFWREYVKGLDENGIFSEIPVHPYMLGFDLQRHEYAWLHIGILKPYIYDKSVRDKLILPQDHRDLIDILTADLAIFESDMVKGKSGGTAILCYGKPGLGKTLTAEVYAEIVGKPLYRVDAGQLGTSIEQVGKNMETILKRAERWGAILLIDEADVYIRKRADDMNQNAIVAAFLRTLEYFNGLLFMTTNRSEEVDDAIVSRMVAVFKYDTPTPEMMPKLWSVLSKQFDCDLKAHIADIVKEFPNVSGRDIKQLLRLTKKYCASKKVPMDLEAFRICSMFRGLK
jgi:hypothetical protein